MNVNRLYIAGCNAYVRRALFTALCMVFIPVCHAQFAPVAGFAGTTAIPGDSSAFVAWASGCSVHRGLRCIAVPDSGYASYGDSSAALGPAGESGVGVVSLGDSGVAILTFPSPIVNEQGFDFAVFENGFTVGPQSAGLAFLELAFIEVSTDGVRYVRFPCIDNVQDSAQIGFMGMDGSRLNNLAGKYIWDYGTPFDLDELVDSPGIDVNNINYVKVIDVIGSINPAYATRDSRGIIINDPFPTNSATSGFDLDAVGVIHQKATVGIAGIDNKPSIQVYPNPAADVIQVRAYGTGENIVRITDLSGSIVAYKTFSGQAALWVNTFAAGVYNVSIINQDGVFTKLIVKQ